jgi:hypothetical protein
MIVSSVKRKRAFRIARRRFDLLPAICREVYMILRSEEECDVEGQA